MSRAADRRGTVLETEVGPRAEDTGPVATGIGEPSQSRGTGYLRADPRKR